ncbi:Protein of unknown function [Sphingopyxis sp. YR583]|uniref:DUF2958 domain-containing protein n=1 Tax=Sphingopyxis sp. YR583 TaxID=1881047 RepID=UPI0008A727EA|nr:DUF2958 domain-containing protein [Sphingopyxis sp. YR583]SEH12608.1 Protein of unknown function [Sphingopyxis sp. YR583]
MILLTLEICTALRANDEARRAAVMAGADEPDFVPLVKFFNPVGAATWLATELGEDGDTLFGLADLGFGCPELGSFSLSELASVRLPFGLGIERDLAFTGRAPLSKWAILARRAGSIIAAETLLRRMANAANDDLPSLDG